MLKKMTKRNKIAKNPWFWLAVIFYFAMFLFGSIKYFEFTLTYVLNDKLLHMLAYGCLTVLIYLGFRRSSEFVFLPTALMTLGWITMLGATDEILQGFVDRDPSFDDWMFDIFGAILAFFVIFLIEKLMTFVNKKNQANTAIDDE